MLVDTQIYRELSAVVYSMSQPKTKGHAIKLAFAVSAGGDDIRPSG